MPPNATPWISIVIPTWNEGSTLPSLLHDLAPLRDHGEVEVIVADGGSSDDTVARAAALGARIVSAPRGRGRQLQAGTAQARSSLLWILHADVRVPLETIEAVALEAKRPLRHPLACRLAIGSTRLSLRCIARGANLRSRLFSLPYGDQGLLITRAQLDGVGGFDDVPLMEDVAIARRLRATSPIRLLPHPLVVSPRRWERDGPWRRSVRNLVLLLRYLRGADPVELAKAYERGSSRTSASVSD